MSQCFKIQLVADRSKYVTELECSGVLTVR